MHNCAMVISMRTTLDLTDEAYHLAKAIAREKDQSLGRTISELILARSVAAPELAFVKGVPVVRFGRPITSEDVQAVLEDE